MAWSILKHVCSECKEENLGPTGLNAEIVTATTQARALVWLDEIIEGFSWNRELKFWELLLVWKKARYPHLWT